jgi:hypothetical protein
MARRYEYASVIVIICFPIERPAVIGRQIWTVAFVTSLGSCRLLDCKALSCARTYSIGLSSVYLSLT